MKSRKLFLVLVRIRGLRRWIFMRLLSLGIRDRRDIFICFPCLQATTLQQFQYQSQPQITMSINVSWQAQKKSLFTHSNPSLAIQSMKSANSHLQQTRNLLHSSIDRITSIKAGVSNTSDNLRDANSMYTEYDEKLRKSQVYIGELKKKEAANARKIKMAFFFLVATVVYVFVRRVLFPGCYRWA